MFSSPSVVAAGSVLLTCMYAQQLEWRTERNKILLNNERKSKFESTQDARAIPSTSYLPRHYDRYSLEKYWQGRPVTVAIRIADILGEAVPIISSYVFDFHIKPKIFEERRQESRQDAINLQHFHARKLKEALTRLGPAFVKGGQQLSIRPDLVPPPVLQELQRLCDSVTPVDDEIAMNVLGEELGLNSIDEISQLFENIELVAAASLVRMTLKCFQTIMF